MPGRAAAIDGATSPSVISRTFAPTSRSSAISASCRSRSRTTTVTSSACMPFAFATRADVLGRRRRRCRSRRPPPARRRSCPCRRRRRGRTSSRARRRAITAIAFGMPSAVSRVPSSGSTATSTSAPCAVADLLAVVEHRRLVLLALADHDDAVHRDRVEHRAASRRRRPGRRRLLVAAPDPAARAHRRRLGHADELEREVPVGRLAVTRRSYAGRVVAIATRYIRSGASTPIRSRQRAITVCVARQRPSRNACARRSRARGGGGRSGGSRRRRGSRRSGSRAGRGARSPPRRPRGTRRAA